MTAAEKDEGLTREQIVKLMNGHFERNHWCCMTDGEILSLCDMALRASEVRAGAIALTFREFRQANKGRCVKWHPAGITSWSPSDWLTAVTGELGELASLLKMRNRERDGLVGNKFSPTDKQIADEIADVFTYLDLLAEVLGIDLGKAVAEKFNEISQRNGFPDRISLSPAPVALPDGWKMVPAKTLERVQAMLTGLLVASCDCFTKRPDVNLHKRYCRYRNTAEALELLDKAMLAAAPEQP